MMDDVTYETGMERVKKELEEMIGKYWPDFLKSKAYVKGSSYEKPREKINALYGGIGSPLEDGADKAKFNVLAELVHGKFWHAIETWSDLKGSLPKEERKFYAELILEKAKRAQLITDSPYPGEVYANCWIVEAHDYSDIKEFIDEKLLKEAVNKGFWEIANNDFTDKFNANQGQGLVSLELGMFGNSRYSILMVHSELLDLSRIDEFYTKPLVAGNWVGSKYVDAFKRAEPKISIENAAKLARPIIQHEVQTTLSPDSYLPREERIEAVLFTYKRFLGTKQIQDVLTGEAMENLKLVKYPLAESRGFYVQNVNILLKYIDPEKNKDSIIKIMQEIRGTDNAAQLAGLKRAGSNIDKRQKNRN